jgi:hypothetical protein
LNITKEHIIWFILILIIVLLAGIQAIGIFSPDKKVEEPKTSQTTQRESSESSFSSEVKEETSDEKNYRKAKLKLEHPYTAAGPEDKQKVADAIEIAVAAMKEDQKVAEVKGTYENRLSMTQNAMVQTFGMAFKINGYQYDASQLEVLKSNSSDVVQFILVLKKEGQENCYFIGNFNTSVQQLQLERYIGGRLGAAYG